MRILGIETSCDETSVAIVEDGRQILVNHIASQVRLHARFGGVVPELASRAHMRQLPAMIEATLGDAGMTLHEVDAIAVTQGPGLVGALLVGVETAKSLAFSLGKPLIPVQHIAGHLYAPFLVGDSGTYRLIVLEAEDEDHGPSMPKSDAGEEPPLTFPFIGLVVSGGHTTLVRVASPTRFEILGETVDDAAGEAFDKVAKLLELGFPGGPVVDKLAREGDAKRFDFPRPMLRSGDFDFSFSGLKTAVAQVVHELGFDRLREDRGLVADLCASFQEAVVEVLLKKAGMALNAFGCRELAIVGGVACNRRLREAPREYLPGIRVVFPPPILCTDNAAMIAGLAWHYRDAFAKADLALNAQADLPLA